MESVFFLFFLSHSTVTYRFKKYQQILNESSVLPQLFFDKFSKVGELKFFLAEKKSYFRQNFLSATFRRQFFAY